MGRIIGISLLLLFGGCVTTPPVVPQLSEETDPFRFALAPNPFTPPKQSQKHFFGDVPFHTEEISADPVEPIKYEASEEPPEEKFQFEPEVLPIITIAEQEVLLLQNQWVQNVNLISMLDTGRRPAPSKISPEERKRQDEIRLINMSPEERARRQSLQYDYVDGSVSDWRWMHRGVDQLSVTPTEQRESADIFLLDKKYRSDPKYRMLRANAAILLGRDGHADVAIFLLPLVRDAKTPKEIRCAAVEVLGHMPAITADDLIPLLDTVKERTIETTDRRTGESRQQQDLGMIDIWAELLMAIAEKIDPWEHVCFLEPFYASSSSIRFETAKIWRRKSLQKQPPSGTLPERFFEIARREHNSQVRVELIRTLGAWQVPNLFSILESDMNHPTVDVRNAAMQALADARCQEAVPIIKNQLKDSNSGTRVAAVSALRKLGILDEVFKLVDDTDCRVQVEVAQALAERRTPQTEAVAKSYLSGRAEIQLATVEAISGWSLDASGPLLLMGAKSSFTNVRRRATEILAQRGISYPDFDPEDRPTNQTAQYDELVHIFRELVGVDPILEWGNKELSKSNNSSIRQVSAIAPGDFALTEVRRCLDDWQDKRLPQNERELIQRRLTAHGQRLMPLIDHFLTIENRSIPETLDRVFAEVEPMFAEIEKLKSGDLPTQQRAARELAQLGTINSPPKIAARRIIDLAARQSDPQVLTSLLTALKNTDPEWVRQLARPLLRSESATVRRMACEMLAQFGNNEDVVLLQETLRDSSREVVREALKGMDTLLTKEETNDPSVFEALQAILLHSDRGLQTDAAATLHRLGQPEGMDALRRLAASHDPGVKLYVAKTISAQADPAFVPLLLRFLDDNNGSVKTEALKGLPRAVGEDIGRAGMNPHSDISQTQQQIDRWKAWAQERTRTGGR